MTRSDVQKAWLRGSHDVLLLSCSTDQHGEVILATGKILSIRERKRGLV